MTRKLFIGAAVLALAGAASTFTARAQDNFQSHVDRAQSKLTEINKLIDGIGTRAASRPSSGPRTAAAVETMKCAACGMEMSTKRANRRQKEISIKGKKFYCCAGCDMSKIVDK